MRNFINEFKPIQDAFESRGFTLYGGDDPCFIAKYADNAYVVIPSDFSSALVFTVHREITDDEFIYIMVTDIGAEYDVFCKECTIEGHPLTWAVGYTVPERYRGDLT